MTQATRTINASLETISNLTLADLRQEDDGMFINYPDNSARFIIITERQTHGGGWLFRIEVDHFNVDGKMVYTEALTTMGELTHQLHGHLAQAAEFMAMQGTIEVSRSQDFDGGRVAWWGRFNSVDMLTGYTIGPFDNENAALIAAAVNWAAEARKFKSVEQVITQLHEAIR